MPETISANVVIGQDALATDYNALRDDAAAFAINASVETVINNGTISYIGAQVFYRVDTEGDTATDDLDTINGGAEGVMIILVAENIARLVTVKNLTGNIDLGAPGDFDLDADCILALIKSSGGNWLEVARVPLAGGNVPPGMIAIADDTCPSGWTRFAALDNIFPRGASVYGGTGGSSTHTHTYTQVPQHSHGPGTLAIAANANHQHAIYACKAGSGYDGFWGSGGTAYAYFGETSSDGAHPHSAWTGASASAGGGATGTSGSGGDLPSYINVIFCQKD